MSLSRKLKKETSIAEKQYQRFDADVRELKIKNDKEKTIKKHNTSNPTRNQDVNKLSKIVMESKCLIEFSNGLKKFQNHKAKKENTNETKKILC